MADIQQFFQTYSLYNSTFKETSLDNENNVYLCTDTSQNVLNFDKLIESIYPNSNLRPRSFDAIYQFANDIYLVEFKNQKPAQIDNNAIIKKLHDGKKELDTFLAKLHIQKRNYAFKYCIVYKNCNKTFDKYKCGISKNIIEFGLEQYKNRVVDDIKTDSVSSFTKLLSRKLVISTLNCEGKV